MIAIVLLLGATIAAQPRPQDIELQAAIRTATVTGDLRAAAEQFKAIAARYPADRATTAKALVELAECYRRLGDPAAQSIYQRIVREFEDQRAASALARARQAPSVDPEPTRRVWTVPPDADVAGPVSYDGRSVAYVDWGDDGKGDLFVHTIGMAMHRRVTQSGNVAGTSWKRFAERAAFSRDGRQVAFSWRDLDAGRHQLRIAGLSPLVGAPASRALVDVEAPAFIIPHDWTRDGHWIAAIWKGKDKDSASEIGFVSTKDGTLRALKSIERPCACDLNLSLSPDGRYLAFDLPGTDTKARDIFVLETDTRREISAVVYQGDDELVGWSPDGLSLLFTSARSGTTGLWAMPFAAGRPGSARAVRSALGAFAANGITRSGDIYFCRCEPHGGSDIKTASVDLATGRFESSPADAVQRFVGTNSQPFWSPDGTSFVYRSLRPNQDPILAIQDTATSDVRELRPRLATVIDPRWSPDGRALAVLGRDFQNRFGIYRIDAQTGSAAALAIFQPGTTINLLGPDSTWPADGRTLYFRQRTGGVSSFVELDVASGSLKELHSETHADPIQAALSPDGRVAYYRRLISADGSQEFAIIARNLTKGTERELIRRLHLTLISLSPDGRLLALAGGNPPSSARTVFVVPTGGGDPREIMPARGTQVLTLGLWAPDGRSVVLRTPPGEIARPEFWWAPLDGRIARKFTEFDGLRAEGLRLHPDGRRLLFGARAAQPEPRKPAEFWVIESVVKR